MAETILLAYNGTSSGGMRVLLSNNHTRIAAMAINVTGFLGAALPTPTAPFSTFTATGYAVPASVWTKLGAVITDTGVRFFANGVMVGAVTVALTGYVTLHIGNGAGLAPSSKLALSSTLALRSSTGTTFHANGKIDEVQRYNVALSDSDVQLYQSTYSIYEPLPDLVLQEGYSDTQLEGAVRTSIEGAVVRRLRYTATPRTLSCSMSLTRNQTAELDWVWKNSLRKGTIPFNFLDPKDGTTVVDAYIPTAPEYRVTGGGYTASFPVVISP